jgi:hypothetical protein
VEANWSRLFSNSVPPQVGQPINDVLAQLSLGPTTVDWFRNWRAGLAPTVAVLCFMAGDPVGGSLSIVQPCEASLPPDSQLTLKVLSKLLTQFTKRYHAE